MKKTYFLSLIIIIVFYNYISANSVTLYGGGKNSTKVDSKDVVGTIEYENAKVDTFTVINLEGKFNIPKIRLSDKAGFYIIPSNSSIKEQVEINKNAAEAFGGSFKIIEENEDGVIFEFFSDDSYSTSNGFNFIIFKKYADSNFLINGMGVDIIENINDLKSAKEAYLVALTFKPE